MDRKGYIIDIQNFSVNDGDGIRTVIFFAGCRLRCQWCSNPESFTNFNKVIYSPSRCIQCGRCKEICPYDCGIDLNLAENRKKCTGCGKCVPVCPVGSRQNMIFSYTAKEIMDKIHSQRIFFRNSNGGITYSGGEATLQVDFLSALVDSCYDRAIHQAMETSGYFDFIKVEGILRKLDLVFMDIKHMDSGRHKYYTGVRNELILEKIKKVSMLPVEVVIRIPTIVNVNADMENILETARFVANNVPNPKIELLPYHIFGEYKYEALAIRQPNKNFLTPTEQNLDELKYIIENEGVEVVSY
ncbi:MAG: glycyl-radical enzyme activating protein [Tissierellia bacterium]|nr:glycyl-radical enzyme activating protein [Tissierellia bacterium]